MPTPDANNKDEIDEEPVTDNNETSDDEEPMTDSDKSIENNDSENDDEEPSSDLDAEPNDKKEEPNDKEEEPNDKDEENNDKENKEENKEEENNDEENKDEENNSNLNSNLDLFNSNDIVITEKIKHVIIDDNIENEVYLNDIQNQLLSEYPLYKQSAKYIQDIVHKQALEIIDLKTAGTNHLKNKYNNNNIIENYANNNFNQYFMIPIVADHKIKYKIPDTEMDVLSNNSNNSTINSGQSDDNVEVVDFKKQLQKLVKLENDLKWDKLRKLHKTEDKSNYNIYVHELYKLLQSFKIDETKQGYKTYINGDSKLLRHHNIDGLNWELRRGISGYYYSVYNSGEDIVENVEVHKGEHVNIVGFFKLPLVSDDIYDVLNSGNSSHRYGCIGDITKIEVGEQTIITCDNHGLEKDDYIYIENSNSIPKINSYYVITQIIDKNKITIETGIQSGTNGDKGKLYSLLRLSYRIHNIVKVNTSFKLQQDKTIVNESKNRLVGDIYLLNNNVSRSEYVNVLKNIVPTYYDIINSLVDTKIDNITNIDDIDKLLERYDFQFSDLDIKETNVFKKLLKDVIVKTEKLELTDSKNIKTKTELFDNKNTDLYKTEYITHPDIVPYYGNYPLLKSPFDNVNQRLKWILLSYDNGQLYYDIVLSKIYEASLSNYKVVDLKEELKTINKELQTINVEYDKEKTVRKYIKTDPCDLYKKTIYPTYNSLEDLKKDTDEDDINKTALVIDETGKTLYKYNGTIWEKEKTPPSYNNVEHLCNFDNLDIEKLDISKLHCIYLSSQCKNKKLNRLDEKIKELESNKDSIESIIELRTGDGITTYFKDKIKESTKRLLRLKDKHVEYESKGGAKKEKNKDENKEKNKEHENKDENTINDNSITDFFNTSDTESNNSNDSDKSEQYSKLLNMIFKIENTGERKSYIYELIERDGLLVNNNIYSKSYGDLIVCGHWRFLYKLSKTSNITDRDEIQKEMCGIYGDNGDEIHNIHTCKTCGQSLGATDFDEFDGGTDGAGNLVQSRMVWDDKMDKFMYDRTKTHQKIDCSSVIFKEKLGLKGITSLHNVNTSVEICKYISDITNNIGVELDEEVLLNINTDCLGLILDLLSETKYKLHEIKKLREKGWDKEKITKLLKDGEKFAKSYQKYLLVNKLSIITARILITFHSAIPEYKITNPSSACSYTGIDGEKGFEYMSCILIAMKLFSDHFQRKTQDENIGFIKSTIEKKYSQFKGDKNIRKMLYRKQDYLDKIEEKTTHSKKVNTYNIDESITIPDNFEEAIKKQEDVIRDYKVVVVNIAKKINKSIHTYINKSTPIESGMTESSCCYSKKGSYYDDIRAHFTDIAKLITRSQELKYSDYLILLNGFYSRYNTDITYNYIGTPHFTHQIEESDTSIIHDKFLFYCYSGEFIGEPHNFIGTGKMRKCTKCNMSYKNISDKTYSHKDFENLKNEIGVKSIITNKEQDILINSDHINSIDNTSVTGIDSLMKILDKYNYKKDIYNKDFIINLGNYNKIFDKQQFKNDKDRILTEESRNSKRIELIKKYINQYFRKYISMILNNQFIPLTTSMYKSTEYEKTYDKMNDIIEILDLENKQFVEYNTKYKEVFEELDFDLSINEVMSVCYTPNKYNKDYTVIVEESKFTADDAISTLLNILVSNLLGMLEKKDEEQQRIISLFIFNVFDKIEQDDAIINIRKSDNVDDSASSSSGTLDPDSPLKEIFKDASDPSEAHEIEEQGIVEQDVEEDNNSDGDDQDYGDGNSDEEMDDDYE
jgi:hypothetical protein